MAQSGGIHIGTSGWHYQHWRGRFYPEKLPASKMLGFYTQHFSTVELNNTFYRLPPENGPDICRVMLKFWKVFRPQLIPDSPVFLPG